MKKLGGVLASLAILCMLAATPLAVSAKHIVHFDVTIAPGTTYQDPQDFQQKDVISCSWTTNLPVKFFLTDPDGKIIRQFNGTSGQAIADVDISGTYTLNWQNTGTTTVSLQFDTGFVHEQESLMLVEVVIVILAVLIAVMLVAIVYLIMRTSPGK